MGLFLFTGDIKMKYLNIVFVAICVMLSTNSYAIGIHSKEITLECNGEISLKSVKKVGVTRSFIDRAGNWNPPKGYAYLESSISSLSESCDNMEEKLEIDLDSKTFEHYFSFETTDEKKVMELSLAKLGEVHEFNANQIFSFKDKAGYLPFFPLIHSEQVVLKSSSISLPGATYKVNVNKVYGISLKEDDKVLLSNLVFEYIKKPNYKGLYIARVVNAMLKNHPKLENNFKVFLEKVLVYYKKLEASVGVDITFGSTYAMLSTITSNIKKLTNQYPEAYAFDIPSLLLHHPSLIYYSNWIPNKAACPNVSAVQLEETLMLLSQNLESHLLNANIMAKWQNPLKVIAGQLWSANINPCLSHISSTFSIETAKNLLKKHY